MAYCISLLMACQAAQANDPFSGTLKAMIWVESRGDPNAVGDGGKAIGVLQIHRDYWADATRFLGVDWPYEDARDPVKAAVAVRAYTRHYVQVYQLPWNAEMIARIHNGGPRGWQKKTTKKYWRSVQAKLFLQ